MDVGRRRQLVARPRAKPGRGGRLRIGRRVGGIAHGDPEPRAASGRGGAGFESGDGLGNELGVGAADRVVRNSNPGVRAMMNAEPKPEHRWLQQFVGEWTFETEAVMGPDQPPMKYTGTESVRTLGDLWVLC